MQLRYDAVSANVMISVFNFWHILCFYSGREHVNVDFESLQDLLDLRLSDWPFHHLSFFQLTLTIPQIILSLDYLTRVVTWHDWNPIQLFPPINYWKLKTASPTIRVKAFGILTMFLLYQTCQCSLNPYRDKTLSDSVVLKMQMLIWKQTFVAETKADSSKVVWHLV